MKGLKTGQTARRGQPEITRLGVSRAFGRDMYHWMRRASWPFLLSTIVCGYLLANLIFAILYVALDADISDVHDGSFLEAFYFSVQTMSTIGYGAMSPQDATAEFLVTAEAVVGLLITATTTGLIFAKFATPTARVNFSNNLIIRKYDGVPTLFMRLANERASFIVEAKVNVNVLRDETSKEGEHMRRFYQLKLARESSPVFGLGWTVMHPIDEESPLHGATPETLREEDAGFLVSVTGIDETLSEPVHARQFYSHDDIKWNARFADMMIKLEDGSRAVDFSKLHDWEPLEPDAVELVVIEGQSAVGE